jgi:hypothetical protein
MYKIFILIFSSFLIFLICLSYQYDNIFSYSNLLTLDRNIIDNINNNKEDISKLSHTLKKLDNEKILNLYDNNSYLTKKIISNEIYFSNEDRNAIFSKSIWWEISIRELYDLYPINEIDTILPHGSRVRISNLDMNHNEKIGTITHSYPDKKLIYFKKNSVGNVILDDGITLYNVPYENIEIVNLTPENDYPTKIFEDNPIPSNYYGNENDDEN